MQIIVIVVIYQLKIVIYTACFIPSHCMAIELQRYHTCNMKHTWKMLGTRNRNGKRNAMTWYSSITYFNLNWINTTWQVAMNYSLFYFSISCFLLHDVWLVDCLCLNLIKYLNKVGVIFWIQYNCKTRQLLSKHAFTL